MIPIPGILIAIATLPGVIVHEMTHQLFCRFSRVAVFDVCYFRAGNPAGYVVHEHPPNPYQTLVIGVAPFLLNSVLGAVIAFPAAIPVLKFEAGSPLDYVLIWLGVSIAMHAFPSTGDAATMRQALSRSIFTRGAACGNSHCGIDLSRRSRFDVLAGLALRGLRRGIASHSSHRVPSFDVTSIHADWAPWKLGI